ncbi:MAG: class SAM-dependent methyltransferase [Bacteroidetes bacterium]|jgi:ubiquinone/menaquinone biosynthesis C-methylase UbiE|nr:class SAM-dependent methyltransferase [Bacteroidota bacterium]
MFTSTSHLYDTIYSFKDYKKESDEIIAIIKSRQPECKTILDIGCGTSEHHKHLNEYFRMDGLDLDKIFIDISRNKNPSGTYTVGDMSDFDLGKQYDVIICLFSSIAYLQSYNKIVAALKCFSRHLKSGGFLIVEPWFNKENLPEPIVHMLTNDKGDAKICRMNRSVVEGDFSILNFQYLIGTLQNGVQHFEEKHVLRLTSKEEMFSAFKEAGFDVSYEEKGLVGRGMYYGNKH